jgi:thymidylate synthase
MNVASVRALFKHKYHTKDFAFSRGSKTVEIIAASFLCDEESIFGNVNWKYVAQELEWYESQSLKLFPDAPKIWQACAGSDGCVNSNYGWCLHSSENGNQYTHVYRELCHDPGSRRAVAIYTRPSMHLDATADGKQDFICTNAVQYLLRGKLNCVIQMRSSDAVLGYRNDLQWHIHVLKRLARNLNVEPGCIYWQAGSLHIYERHFEYLQ